RSLTPFPGLYVPSLRSWLRPSAEVFGEERLGRRVELEAVLGPREAVTLVRKEHVLDRLAAVAQRRHDLLALSLLHPRLVSALRDEHRALDPIRLVERRARIEKVRLGLGVAHAH